MTAIIDYGVGNLFSLKSSFAAIGAEAVVTSDPAVIAASERIILPGVGAFPDAAEKLHRTGLTECIRRQSEKKPILGICLGMQLLFEKGYEVRETPGLGFVPGTVERIETDLKLPHIGWNSLSFPNPSPLFAGIDEGSYVYFVHSFCGRAAEEKYVIAATDYGARVTAAVQNGNVYGTQFHPEKSGEVGLQILRNFGGLNR
jgi:glutamine amidotransferase